MPGGAHRFQEARIGKASPGSDETICFNFASLLQQRGKVIAGARASNPQKRFVPVASTLFAHTRCAVIVRPGRLRLVLCEGADRKDTEGLALQIVDHHAGASESSNAKRLNAQFHLPPFVLLAKFPALKSNGWWDWVTDKKAATRKRTYF